MKPLYAFALTFGLLLATTGCTATRTTTSESPSAAPAANLHKVRTMLTGLDQFPAERIVTLSTGHGVFVVGPEVQPETRAALYERLIGARNELLTITYRDMPATGRTLEHRRVVGLVIGDAPFDLNR